MRERFLAPRIRVKGYDELNAWLLDQAIADAKAHRHPEFTDQTVWQVLEAERASLVPYPGRFDRFHAVSASVSRTCLERFDNNRYPVAASAVGRPVEIRQDGRVVGKHPRSFGRDPTISDPWHYVPVLARKPRPAGTSRATWTLRRVMVTSAPYSTSARSALSRFLASNVDTSMTHSRLFWPDSSP